VKISMLRAHNKVGPGTPYELKKDKRKFDAGGSGSLKRRKVAGMRLSAVKSPSLFGKR